MERAEKIRLLQSYIDIEKTIQELNDKYEELFTASTKITPSYSEGGFGGGFDSSKIEKNCLKLVEITTKRDKLIAKKQKIDEAIKPLQYSQRRLIEYVSLQGHSINQASRFFRRTHSNTKASFNNALDKINL